MELLKMFTNLYILSYLIVSTQLIAVAILLFTSIAHSSPRDEKSVKVRGGEGFRNFKNDTSPVEKQTRTQQQKSINQKYSSRIVGNRYALTDNVFGIRTFPVSKTNVVDDKNHKTKIKIDSSTTTESVLDFRIAADPKRRKEGNKVVAKDNEDDKKNKDMSTASAGGGKQKKEADDDDEKTLAQQVADGKYGLIQNEIFANGSKRTGIISYSPNSEVPKDTKENLGGLEKDEIWLAEDHILVLRGGNYQDIKENETPSSPKWPPIDDYRAPNRQVKIPKNPEIPPPFPVQLSEDGPVEFVKGQQTPPPIPPVIPSLPPFTPDANKTVPFPFPIPNAPPAGNKTLPFPIPPHLLPPFLSNLPPGATFVAPPDNRTDFDEDDPSIYYPPKYDFYYPLDNTTAVPPGPLVPGIILPPPPDFFSLLENDTNSLTDYQNETDDSINSVTPTYVGPKYLPANRKLNRPRISSNRYLKRPITVTNLSDANNIPESSSKPDKPAVTYVYPENSKSKSLAPSTPSYNSFRTSIKVPPSKHINSFSTPIFVPSNPNRSLYHPLPTTSPKPNHITLPTTKTLPKQIFIITTPETVDKNRIEDIYKKSKPVDVHKYEAISPELHPLRSLIKPNVTVSYNGKYGHLPPATVFPHSKPQDNDDQIIRGHIITQPPVTKASKAPSTDINSITVTPIPVIKKIRVHPIPPGKPEIVTPPSTPPKATFYFYEEPSTTEIPTPVQKPEKPKETPTKIQFNPEGGVKTETKPVTQYYYTTKSTTKTPIRQFLEETFHSSNVLPRKPQIAHINNAEIITHNGYSDIPKMKHLNYGTHVSPKPVIKYHYVTEDNAVIIPSPKIKDLEIKNSGSSGLQNVNLDKAAIRPTPKPIIVQEVLQPTQKPEPQNPPSVTYVATPKPTEYKTADGPFVPSNYYATVRPEHIHFTSQEQTLVDDITKNYFTIFGQKINSPSTTPLTPVKTTGGAKNKSKPESGLTYISDDGHNFKIQQVHESSARKPGKSSTVFYTSEKPKVPSSTRPPSNFEKYLKELTGEDQSDYIISGVFPAKIKKGKGFAGAPPILDGIPSHLLSQGPIIFRNEQVQVSQPSPEKNSEQDATRPKIPYHPSYSTTLRPVVDVEIKPQYIQHLSPVSKPLEVYRQPIPPQNIRVNHNFQQYLQELTGLTSPTTTRPVKVKKPNLEYFPTTPSPLKAISYQQPPFQLSEVKPKPIPLEGDILVNYKQPRPPINQEAELINLHNPRLPFDLSPNIKIVDSPDLSRNPNQAYSTKQITFGVAKDLLENLPKSGYFTEPHQPGGNSFVSYNLPGNGGHFYFLTPQIVEKEKDEDIRRGDKGYKRVSRSEDGSSRRSERNVQGGGYSSQIEHNLEDGYSNHDYLRRRRKKP